MNRRHSCVVYAIFYIKKIVCQYFSYEFQQHFFIISLQFEIVPVHYLLGILFLFKFFYRQNETTGTWSMQFYLFFKVQNFLERDFYN